MPLYDTIGQGYRQLRQPDPRIGAAIRRALGSARSVLNVGAGAGSYEPPDLETVAVEPSDVMVRQRPPAAAPAVRATADALPFRDAAFDASLAILTVHHWGELAEGLDELRRTARQRTVLFTHDPDFRGFWLTDYFPEILDIDRRSMPTVDTLRRHLGSATVHDVPVPHDCTDGFLAAYWRRPHAYLDERVRAAISVFWKVTNLEAGLARLRDDLDSGAWQRRYGSVLELDHCDVGYRLVVA